MNAKVERYGLIWTERETAYGRAYDLEVAPPRCSDFSILELERAHIQSSVRRQLLIAALTRATTALLAGLLIFVQYRAFQRSSLLFYTPD